MILTVKKSHLSGGTFGFPGQNRTPSARLPSHRSQKEPAMSGIPMISEDTLAAVRCYRQFGAEIDTQKTDLWTIEGTAGRINASNENY